MVATAEVPKGVAAERLRRHYRRPPCHGPGRPLRGGGAGRLRLRRPVPVDLVTAFKQNRDLYNPENNPFFNLAATPPTTSCTCCMTPPS